MTDRHLDEAIETFLDAYDAAKGEYDSGYVDADATLSVVDSHVTALRESVERDE